MPRHAQKVSTDKIAESYKNTQFSIQTKVCYDKLDPSKGEPAFLFGQVNHLNIQDDEQKEVKKKKVLVTMEENANHDDLVKRRKILDRSFLRCFCHYKPSNVFQSYLGLNTKIDGTLRQLICEQGGKCCDRGVIGGYYMVDILSQIGQAIRTSHREGITFENISMDSIYFFYKDERPIIKVDPKVNNDKVGSLGPLRNDWKNVGNLIGSIQDLLLEDAYWILEESKDLISLQDILTDEGLNLDRVEKIFFEHPGLWDKQKRLHFLLQFVEKQLDPIMNYYGHPLIEEIEKNKENILPVNWSPDWKKCIDSSFISSMEGARKDYMTRRMIIHDKLDFDTDYDWVYDQIERERNYEYKGNSAVDYIKFMRNFISHFDKAQSMYRKEAFFRKRLQPRTLLTLYNIMDKIPSRHH